MAQSNGDFGDRARDIIRTANQQMQQLLAEIVESRQYDALAALAPLATSLGDLLNGKPDVGEEPSAESTAPRPTTPPSGAIKSSAGYPQFWREGDALVKVGWSTSNRAPYEHKADRGVVDAVVSAIASVTAKRKRFQTADLEKAQRASASASVPNYQLYVALGWLRWAGLIRQHGRQGYSVQAPNRFLEDVKSSWAQIATR